MIEKCQFSEKFYETLFNHELLSNANKPRVFIPSQKLEEKVGYDVFFKDGPKRVMFIQFKVPYWYDTDNNEYRFKLHPGFNNEYKQHNKLCDYNIKRRKMKAVYYAPLFLKTSELDYFSKNNSIKKHSKCFYPRPKNKIQIPTTTPHYVEYNNRHATRHSDDESEIKTFESFEELLAGLELEPMNLEEFEKEIKDLYVAKNISSCFLFFNPEQTEEK